VFSFEANEKWQKVINALGIFITFNAVTFAWILFRANSLADAYWIAGHLFPASGFAKVWTLGLSRAELLVAALSVIILEVIQFAQRHTAVRKLVSEWPISIRWPVYYLAIFAVLLFGKFGSQRFIYFQF
jgi:hypothetical protein